MASQMPKRVMIVTASSDTKRISQVFEDRAADRVYILSQEVDEETNNSNLNSFSLTEDVVLEKTQCGKDDVIPVEIDFHSFRDIFINSFEVIYKEENDGNQVLVNISTGSKPVPVALCFACCLNSTGIPIYYRDSEDIGGESYDGKVSTFNTAPLNLVELSDILPKDNEKHKILNYMLDQSGSIGVTEMLVRLGDIKEEPPDDSDKRSRRSRIVQKYHRHASKLEESNILKKVDSEYEITDTGELIAGLVDIKKKVDGRTTLSNY
jgi:hypothetical protein